ncbi:MucBP domain-containing protein [Listeria ilorinensis]|uniref:MucBP domain-containing protein n=1 Tax=Listeria ilorinensis TaxID=2867439 RepID=UPI001EF40C21|nr:MucBP domain-containing protein [Listeria ilorinensis]
MKKIFITILVGTLFVSLSVPAAATEQTGSSTMMSEEVNPSNTAIEEADTDTATSEEVANPATVVTEKPDMPETQTEETNTPVVENKKATSSLKASADEVNIPDAGLRKIITQTLGKSDDAVITEEDMEQITEISNYSTTIDSLEGLQYATNLKKLMLSNIANPSKLSDITPISQLTSLETLNLSYASISDISLLAGLKNLTGLTLHGNQIRDISVLANLPKLKFLGLSDNLIENIDVLAQLTNLTSIQMNGPIVNYIGTPDQIQGNSISDLSPLANLTKLTYLEMSGYGPNLTDISPLSGLVNLETLNMFDNKIVDISAVENMTHLRLLQMDHNDIQIVPDMSKLTSLTCIKLNDSPNLGNDAVEKIGQAVNLTDITLGKANGWEAAPKINNIEPLANLTKLRSLTLVAANVSDISPLADLPLVRVNLHSNKIKDVTPLAGKHTYELNLRGNQITDISSLDIFSDTSFNAQNQNVTLEDGYQNAPTAVKIAENSGAVPGLTWTTAGNYTDGKLAWDNPGANQVNFASTDGLFTGTIKQQVQAGDPPIPTSSIVVKYVDEEGNELESADTYTGNVGDSQTIEAKTIAGYTLKEGQTSPQTLTYTTDAQTVEYVYAADPAPATDSIIAVKYVDEEGNEIAPSDLYTGPIGADQTIEAKTIAGYTLKEGQASSQTLTYTAEAQNIQYVYVADPAPATDSTITVKYMDENGLELTSSDTYTGKIGEQETIQAKDIAGYVLKEGQTNPQNLIYTSENQTVTFIYVSSAVPANNDADSPTPTPSQPTADGSTPQQINPTAKAKTSSVINNHVTSLPKTGDTSNSYLWIGLACLLLGSYVLRKQKKHSNS